MKPSKGQKLLEVSGLTMDFGGLRAVDNVGLDIFAGEIVALIGPNGAGKTTFFNCVTGIYTPTAGEIRIHPAGRRQPAHQRSEAEPHDHHRHGTHLSEHPPVPGDDRARERHDRPPLPHPHDAFSTPILNSPQVAARGEGNRRERAIRLLEKVGLAEFADEFARNLPYGAQRRLEIARALATDPFLLLLDEPAAGMNPHETHDLDELIVRIRAEEEWRSC